MNYEFIGAGVSAAVKYKKINRIGKIWVLVDETNCWAFYLRIAIFLTQNKDSQQLLFVKLLFSFTELKVGWSKVNLFGDYGSLG